MTNAGKIMYSDDAVHWHFMKDFMNPVSWAVMDPANVSTLYVTVLSELSDTIGGVWKCSGLPASPVWSRLSSPPRTERRPTQIFKMDNGDILAVFGARDSSTGQPVSYSFTASSGVFLSDDDGNTWTDLCSVYPGMQKDTRFLTIDPQDPSQNTWFAGVGSSGTGSVPGLYRTTDRGNSWVNIWPGKTVLTCTFHPSNPGEMYICTANDGLFYATDVNSENPVITPVAGYPFRAPERVFFNPYDPSEVWVASWGNGLRVGHTTISHIENEPTLADINLLIFPNPANGDVRIQTDIKEYKLCLYNSSGICLWTANTASVIPTGIFKNGLYILRMLLPGGKSYRSELIINR
jgi:hypothetical protein